MDMSSDFINKYISLRIATGLRPPSKRRNVTVPQEDKIVTVQPTTKSVPNIDEPAKMNTEQSSGGYVLSGLSPNSTGVGVSATAEGYDNWSTGNYSHAEGLGVCSSGYAAHAEGSGSVADGNYSHAEGRSSEAIGHISHAEGKESVASGDYSNAGGYKTESAGIGSTSRGVGTLATGVASVVAGQYNVKTGYHPDRANDMLVIGNGKSDEQRSNCFSVSANAANANSYCSSGTSYSEMFEWKDGNVDNEDRRGRFVTLEGSKISLASAGTNFILGVVSGNPSIVGDSQEDQWKDMYQRDEFGELSTAGTNVEGIIPLDMENLDNNLQVNQNYDSSQKYIPRSERPEWSPVSMVGKCVMVDDGTSEIDGYVAASDGGVATLSESATKYRCIERLDKNLIRILILP